MAAINITGSAVAINPSGLAHAPREKPATPAAPASTCDVRADGDAGQLVREVRARLAERERATTALDVAWQSMRDAHRARDAGRLTEEYNAAVSRLDNAASAIFTHCNSDLAALCDAVERLSSERDDARSESDELAASLREVGLDLERANESRASLRQLAQQRREEADRLRAEHDTLSESARVLTVERDAARHDLDDSRNVAAGLVKDLRVERAAIDLTVERLAAVRAERDAWSALCTRLVDTVASGTRNASPELLAALREVSAAARCAARIEAPATTPDLAGLAAREGR